MVTDARSRWAILCGTIAILGLTVVAPTQRAREETWSPPRLKDGAVPDTPAMAIAGGEVFLEVTVSGDGTVSDIRVLRSTPSFTEMVVQAVREWTFQPAARTLPPESGSQDPAPRVVPVESRVFVGAVFRPPTLNVPTLGSPPVDVASPTREIAAPVSWVAPAFPPRAFMDGTVLTEVTIDAAGRLAAADVIRPAAGFDDEALRTARQWAFRQATIDGRSEQTYAYVAFSFRRPVTDLPDTPAGSGS